MSIQNNLNPSDERFQNLLNAIKDEKKPLLIASADGTLNKTNFILFAIEKIKG